MTPLLPKTLKPVYPLILSVGKIGINNILTNEMTTMSGMSIAQPL